MLTDTWATGLRYDKSKSKKRLDSTEEWIRCFLSPAVSHRVSNKPVQVGQSSAGASLYKIAVEQSVQIYRHGLQKEYGWVRGLIYSTVRRIRILPSTATSSLSFI